MSLEGKEHQEEEIKKGIREVRVEEFREKIEEDEDIERARETPPNERKTIQEEEREKARKEIEDGT